MGTTAGWYLGLEFSTQGLRAVLCNPVTGTSYPLFWQGMVAANRLTEPVWQLAAIAHLPSSFSSNPEAVDIQLPLTGLPAPDGVLLCDLKAAFEVGLPYISDSTHDWEPQLDWYFQAAQPQRTLTPQAAISLTLALKVLTQLLSTLQPERTLPQMGTWSCGAEGLTAAQTAQSLGSLEGVIISCPAACNEAYRFNLREAVLTAELVTQPEQITFLEVPIAALLAEFNPDWGHRFVSTDWQGATLVVHAGTSATELGLVCLPNTLHNLTHEDFKLRRFEYGAMALQQDIACQLLAPFIPEPHLGLDMTVLPIPGEPDCTVRSQLQRQLYQSPAGLMLLEGSAYLQQVLQRQERITFEFGPYACTFSQKAMDTKVTQPFVIRLNRELNRLFSEAGVVAEGITQVICTGNGITQPAIGQWLKQKLPQARFIQSERQMEKLIDHRIAYGLVSLPLYPQVLDRNTQQYSDYFLLMELLRSLPLEALTLDEILGHLETLGINTHACKPRVLAILQGQIPSGLVPEPADIWASRRNADYQSLQMKPLFRQISAQSFQIDQEQRQRFLDYWAKVTAHTQQTLEEPYSLGLGVSVMGS